MACFLGGPPFNQKIEGAGICFRRSQSGGSSSNASSHITRLMSGRVGCCKRHLKILGGSGRTTVTTSRDAGEARAPGTEEEEERTVIWVEGSSTLSDGGKGRVDTTQPSTQEKSEGPSHPFVLVREVLRGAEMHCILTGVKM